jgi:branched-chain amino acid transport system ATP-binding protein
VFEDLTVEENLIAATLALKGRVGAAKPDFDRLFEYFPRLAERRQQRAGYLSGGEQQMLAISRALVGQPNLILLDEPSLGLAPKVVEEIFAIIARINREQGVAMLLVEQNAFAAFGICSDAYIMENGKVVVSGPVDRLRNDADVKRFYLGYSEGASEVASFREVKHYKRRKRWLS